MPTPSYPWVVREGDAPLPPGYEAHTGYRPDVSTINNPGYSGYGQTGARPTFSAPVYTTRDLDSMWGKGAQYVYPTNDLLYKMGYLSADVARRSMWSAEAATALQEAMADANRNGMTLDQMYAQMQQNGALAGGGPGSGSGRRVSTSRSVSYNLTTREAAHQVLASVLAQELGRAPTNGELSKFLRTLNAVERANPTVSTSTTVSTGGKSTTSSSSVGKNVSASGEAEKWASDNKALAREKQGYQGALYYDVIAQMVGL